MGFLAPLQHACDACEATGYTAEARRLVVRGRSLAELESLTLDEVLGIWEDHDAVARPLRAAVALGLGYLALGQQSLSGGERQRLKLTRELAKPASRPTLYILDEPTTGLHAVDTAQLAEALSALVGAGHTVLVVEHDPVLLACCDHLVELGPGGGPAGGRVIASGTPEQLASGDTPIAPHLRGVLR
jgi:excinuclease ABC subunit A